MCDSFKTVLLWNVWFYANEANTITQEIYKLQTTNLQAKNLKRSTLSIRILQRILKGRFPNFFQTFLRLLLGCTYCEFTWLPTRIFLWSTIPQVAMPIKWTCWALSLSWAPRDMTVWPRTASPTWRMTPVFVPPVMIQAPVVSAACEQKVIVL